jgi:Zn-dependent peptidase ImmA (M78 family)
VSAKAVALRIREARRSAVEVLDRFAIETAPVNVERVARRLGAQVRYGPLEGDLSGMVTIQQGVCVIGINSLHPIQRQRFTLAHELGHFCLHREDLENEIHLDRGSLRRDWLSSQGVEVREIEANAFAAELLMPTRILERMLAGRAIDFEDEEAIEPLARKFKVSTAAMRFRLIRATSEVWS